MTNVIKTRFILHGGDTSVLHSMSALQVHQKVSAGWISGRRSRVGQGNTVQDVD